MGTEEKSDSLPPAPASLEGAILNRARRIVREHSYDVGNWPTPSPDRQQMLRQISRSTEIVGRMLDGIAHDHAVARRPSRFLVGIGRLIWSIAEMATRNSLAGVAARYWLSLLLFAEALLVIGSYIFGRVEVRPLAWELLAITFGFGVLIELAGIWIAKPTFFKNLLGITSVSIALGTVALAVFGWPVAMHEFSRVGPQVAAAVRLVRTGTLFQVGALILVAGLAFLAGRYRLRHPPGR